MDHIGIDVHKAQSQLCILSESGERTEQRIPTDRVRFGEVFGGRSRARILIEASTGSEWLDEKPLRTQAEARMAVFDFIEGWHNPHRRHSGLGYRSPITYERETQPKSEFPSA